MIDSGLLAPTWAGTQVEAVVGDEAWLRAMLEAEAGLARAQARLGLSPRSAADVITAVAGEARLDVVDLARKSRAAANPVVAFVPAFTRLVAETDPAAAEYVHRGSTSQDILDTATMLVARDVLRLLEAGLVQVACSLAMLADEHRETLQAGRTLSQHAVPITFGLKASGWLNLVLDALSRVRTVLAGLPAELGGAAGTLSAYAAYAEIDSGTPLPLGGAELIAPFAEELGLAEPVTCWHTLRTPIADLGAVLQFVTGTLGKLALDVQVLCRTEIGELAEPFETGRGASSAMPRSATRCWRR
jgi:3-carboxy-cis,cis-muconate cycloisomerase